MEVHDRKNISFVLVPDYMDKGKEITNHISSVIKRSLFSTIPDKKFKEYFRTQLMNHIKTKDVKRLIVSYTGNHHLDKLWQFFGNFFNLVLSCFVIFKKFLKLYRLSRGWYQTLWCDYLPASYWPQGFGWEWAWEERSQICVCTRW